MYLHCSIFDMMHQIFEAVCTGYFKVNIDGYIWRVHDNAVEKSPIRFGVFMTALIFWSSKCSEFWLAPL